MRKNANGFTLIEVLVALGVLSIVSIGAISLSSVLQKYNNQAVITQTLAIIRENLRANITNSQAWQNTINDTGVGGNDEMLCLKNGTNCASSHITPTPVAGAPPYRFRLRDPSDQIVFDPLDAFTAADLDGTKRGFTRDGAPCSAFNEAGNNNCPIRYTLSWKPLCPPLGIPCNNPSVRVKASTIYRPEPGTPLDIPISEAKYSINIIRAAADIYEPFVVQHVRAGAGGEGTCSTGGVWSRRALGTLMMDSGQNVIAATTNSFTVLPGTYKCRVASPAFKVGATRIRIRNVSGSSVSAYGQTAVSSTSFPSQVMALLETSFSVAANTELVVEQTCDVSSGGFDLGVPFKDDVGAYTNSVYTAIECVRTK